MEYNEESFWAGVLLGQQLRGWGTYGRPEGFNPDGDLILRPINQGIARIDFSEYDFTIGNLMDIVESVFPDQELPGLTQEIGRIGFGGHNPFTIHALNERLIVDQVIQAFTIDNVINPLEYDDTIVFINSDGAFTMDNITRTFTSVERPINVGTMQEVTVSINEFAEVSGQEVTA